MKEKNLTTYNPGDPTPESLSNWEKLEALTEEEILAAAKDDPDTIMPDDAFWESAIVTLPDRKEQITLKLDPKILSYFKKTGKGYQTRINSVLKTYVENMEKRMEA